jgi:hypothetical protein
MKNFTIVASRTVAGAVALAALGWSTLSAADTVVVPVSQPVTHEQTTSSPPNAPLLTGGLIAFGGAYIPSVIVAAANNNNSYDNHLYIPVVGPWLDLGNRPSCGNFGQPGCGTENGFKALLVIDGAFQGLGALATVIGLVTPQHHTVVTAKAEKVNKPSLHLFPAQVARGAYGLAAFGNF